MIQIKITKHKKYFAWIADIGEHVWDEEKIENKSLKGLMREIEKIIRKIHKTNKQCS